MLTKKVHLYDPARSANTDATAPLPLTDPPPGVVITQVIVSGPGGMGTIVSQPTRRRPPLS